MDVMVATLICDRKAASQQTILENLKSLHAGGTHFTFYLNIESTQPKLYQPIRDFCAENNIKLITDVWNIESGWWNKPSFDQDMARLFPITMAREMARYAAVWSNFSHLLYIDADVVVPSNSIEVLLAMDKDICGGSVPGRGVHSHVSYHGGKPQPAKNGIMKTDYATAGFMMIKRCVFQCISWRYGYIEDGRGPFSEDPLYAHYAAMAGFDLWYVNLDLIAKHLDDPEHPLSTDGISNTEFFNG